MPLFKYQAQDISGHLMEGVVEADHEQHASDLLQAKGLTAKRIYSPIKRVPVPKTTPQVNPGAGQTQTPPPSRMISYNRPGSTAPVTGPQNSAGSASATPSASTSPQVTPDPARPRRRDRRPSPNFQEFLFSQIRSYLQSGQTLAVALERLGAQNRTPSTRAALEDIRQRTIAGETFASGLARYPDLFSPHVVGMVKAGEMGGFLPEACSHIVNHATSERRLNYILRGSQIFIWSTVLGCLGLIPAEEGLFQGFKATDTTEVSNAGGGMQLILHAFWQQTVRFMPLYVAGLALYYILHWLWYRRQNLLARHAAALKVPTFGKLFRAESNVEFWWALSRLSEAGLPPGSIYQTATECTPNRAYGRSLLGAVSILKENSSISELMRNSGTFDYMDVSRIETGEMTGSVPGALAQLSNLAEAEKGQKQIESKTRLGCWLFLVAALSVLFFAWLIYGRFYGQVFDWANSQ